MDSKPCIDISEYHKNVISRRSRALAGRYGFLAADLEDIQQELTLHLIDRLRQFPEKRRNDPAVIRLLISQKIASMIRHSQRLRRDYRRKTSLVPESAGTSDEIRSIDIEQGRGLGSTDNVDLSLDLAAVIATLDPELQAVCRDLSTMSKSDIARARQISRSLVYKHIHRLRQLFRNAGLDAYI